MKQLITLFLTVLIISFNDTLSQTITNEFIRTPTNRFSETNIKDLKELKPQEGDWKDKFREKQLSKRNINNKTVINKKLLENGFLIIEEINEEWNGSALVNRWKSLYKYQNVTKFDEDIGPINSFSLSNNYPNPFNPTTTIRYSIPIKTNVTLKVFDVLGSEVATLVNKEQSQGNSEVEFDASKLTSGIYFYRQQVGNFVETKKMLLIK